MEMVSTVPANNDEFDDEPLHKKSETLCASLYAPECASEHLKSSKFPGGACPQTSLEWRAAMLTTLPNDIGPPDGKGYEGPEEPVLGKTILTRRQAEKINALFYNVFSDVIFYPCLLQ